MRTYDVTIEGLSSTDLDELIDAIAAQCGGHMLEKLTIVVG